MDITLEGVLTILDEHYNNLKALDALTQELFQLWMADKETVSDWDVHLSRHLLVLAASFPDCFPPDWVAELKRDHFYGGLPKRLKAMVACLKVGLQARNYSDYLRATCKAEKEDSIELPQGPRTQTTDNPPKPRTTSFFPEETQGQPAPPEKACCTFGAFRRRGHQQWWRSREWWSRQNRRSYRRVYGLLGKGCKGCPSRWETLLPL